MPSSLSGLIFKEDLWIGFADYSFVSLTYTLAYNPHCLLLGGQLFTRTRNPSAPPGQRGAKSFTIRANKKMRRAANQTGLQPPPPNSSPRLSLSPQPSSVFFLFCGLALEMVLKCYRRSLTSLFCFCLFAPSRSFGPNYGRRIQNRSASESASASAWLYPNTHIPVAICGHLHIFHRQTVVQCTAKPELWLS